jgi:hypothetical protein
VGPQGPKATISLAEFTSGTDLLSQSETELLEAALTPKRRQSGVNSPAKKLKLTDECEPRPYPLVRVALGLCTTFSLAACRSPYPGPSRAHPALCGCAAHRRM